VVTRATQVPRVVQQGRDDGEATIPRLKLQPSVQTVEQRTGKPSTANRVFPVRNLDREPVEQAARVLIQFNRLQQKHSVHPGGLPGTDRVYRSSGYLQLVNDQL
jgi:hypothetical protein